MKASLQFVLGLFCIVILGCNDDETTKTLPDATQTGRGIFACYVDGKPFIDNSGSPNGISFNCFYQYLDGEYYFGIGADDDLGIFKHIYIYSEKRNILEGYTYQLKERVDGNFSAGGGFVISPTDGDVVFTNSSYSGELHIMKFDLANQIVSGTFWFDIQNPYTGETVKITNGRFDTHFGL